MRKLGIALSFLAAFGLNLVGWAVPAFAEQAGPINELLCNRLPNLGNLVGTGSSVTTLVKAAATNQIIIVCGWHVTESGSTSGTFQLEYGTQTTNPCDTGTTILTPAFSVSSTAPATDHIDYASLSTPAGNQLCVVTTGAATSTLQVGVWLAQF